MPVSRPADRLAEAKARFSASWDTATQIAEPPEVEQAPVPCPPGFVAWRLVGTTSCTVLPQLLPNAPVLLRRAYGGRILSNLTGICPFCGMVADVNVDPETHPVGWRVLDVTIGIRHVPNCSGLFEERHRKWFDPRAVSQP